MNKENVLVHISTSIKNDADELKSKENEINSNGIIKDIIKIHKHEIRRISAQYVLDNRVNAIKNYLKNNMHDAGLRDIENVKMDWELAKIGIFGTIVTELIFIALSIIIDVLLCFWIFHGDFFNDANVVYMFSASVLLIYTGIYIGDTKFRFFWLKG